CGDGRGEGVGDARESREIVVRGGIFQPEQVIGLHATADVDGLVYGPELVDIAHEVDVGTDRLPHHANALDGGRGARLAPALHLHLAEAHVAQARTCLGEVV